MSSRLRIALIAVGVLLTVGTPVAWSLSQPDTTAGELPSALQDEPGSDEPGSDEPGSDEPGSDEPTGDAVGETSTSSPEAEEEDPAPGAPSSGPGAVISGSSIEIEDPPQRPARPVGVSLPSIGVQEAPVVEVGLDDNRAVEIPEDVREVGWYGLGPRPGEPGNAFMTSHVDSREQGPGVLFNLSQSQPGDLIEVLHEDGSKTDWEVVFRERIVKGSYPFDRVFRFDGQPGLVIDTCGGLFDRSTGNYENIDIIYAVPFGEDLDDQNLSAGTTTD
ncbi:MAG: sortase domain-bontaining protein [Nitriliruptoraceae bacterium]